MVLSFVDMHTKFLITESSFEIIPQNSSSIIYKLNWSQWLSTTKKLQPKIILTYLPVWVQME